MVQTLRPAGERGMNRVVWNLRFADLPMRGGGGEDGEGGGGALAGPYVVPGTYVVRLTANGRTQEQRVEVREDPRVNVSAADRKMWTDTLLALAQTIRQAAPVNERVQKASGSGAELGDLKRQWRELMSRLSGVYGEIGRWTGRPNADQMSEVKYYTEMVQKLTAAAKALPAAAGL
jgi:hypothetical protein